jgi:YD repeat-containing protein
VTYTLQSTGTALPACSTTTALSTGSIAQAVILDGYGRKSETTLLSDPDGTTSTVTAYDGDGNVESVTIPFRSVAQSGYTTSYQYDGLNRKRFAYNPDSTSQSSSSFEEWSYAGNIVTFQDENGNQWQRTTDALGNLTEVLEPNGAGTSPTMETDYGYDGFDNLWSVKQWGGPANSTGSRVRSFSYDGMSRLLQATNPESGNATFVYDAVGNLTSKTLPAPNTTIAGGLTVTTNYGHDALNRITSKSYTNDNYKTPWTCFQYGLPSTGTSGANQVGRLMNEWTQPYNAGSCSGTIPASGFLTLRKLATYDAMGRVTQEQQCTPSNCATSSQFSISNSYDLTGNVLSYTNGILNTPGATSEPFTLTQTFGGAGRVQTMSSNWSDTVHPASLFSAQSVPAYAPQGALESAILGNNALTLSRSFDTRLRVNAETIIGDQVASPTSGTAAVTISGAEQTY